jgi:hypothetical protein
MWCKSLQALHAAQNQEGLWRQYRDEAGVLYTQMPTGPRGIPRKSLVLATFGIDMGYIIRCCRGS